MKKTLFTFILLTAFLSSFAQSTLPSSSKVINNQFYRAPDGRIYLYMGYNFNPLAYYRISSYGEVADSLALKINLTEKAAVNGVATLDGTGKVPLTQINDALIGSVNYKGTYNASTNSPTLGTASSVNKGWYYKVSTAGTQGGITYAVGDWAISNGIAWEKLDNNSSVTSVFGRMGAVTAQAGDYAAFYEVPLTFGTGLTRSTNTITINQAFPPTWTGQHTFNIPIISNGGDFRAMGSLAPVGPVLSSNYDVGANPKTLITSYGQSSVRGGTEFRHVNGSGTGSITSAYGNPDGDWLFYYNLKLPNQTASRVLVSDASNNVVASGTPSANIAYLDATSSIQTQLNGKQATISGTGLANFSGSTPSFITNNSTNWNTAYGCGNHSGLYLPIGGGTLTGGLTGTTGSFSGNLNSTTKLQIKNWDTFQPSSATPDILQIGGMNAPQWGTIDMYVSGGHQIRIGYGNTWMYGNVIADGNVTSNSDIRLKKNLEKLGDISDVLMQINAYSFDWRKSEKHDKGFVAQNIEKYFPEFVVTGEDGKKIKSVAYGKMTVPLLQGWQEHEKRINTLYVINSILGSLLILAITYILIKRK